MDGENNGSNPMNKWMIRGVFPYFLETSIELPPNSVFDGSFRGRLLSFLGDLLRLRSFAKSVVSHQCDFSLPVQKDVTNSAALKKYGPAPFS